MPILEFECSSVSSNTSSPASTRPAHVNTKMENSTVHAEPQSSTTDTSPTSESRSVENDNQSIPSQLPFLRESLRPITLKVRSRIFICYIQ